MPKTSLKFGTIMALSGFVCSLASCGGGSSVGGSSSNATLVVVSGSMPEPVSVSVDGKVLATNVAYLSSTDPFTVKSGNHQLVMQAQGGGQAEQAISLAAGTHDTFIADGTDSFASLGTLFTDDTTPAGGGSAKIRVVDGADTLITMDLYVDVYVVPSGSVPSGMPTFSRLSYGGVDALTPSYQIVPAGSYDIFFSPSGTTDVLYHTGAITLGSGQNRTVILLDLCAPIAPEGMECDGQYTSTTVPDLN